MLVFVLTSVLLLSTSAFADTDEDIVTWTTTCSQDQFFADGYCYIECSVNKDKTDPLEWTNFAWKYYPKYNGDSNPGYDFYQLFDNVNNASTETAYTVGLNLSSVSAGYYVCEFTFSDGIKDEVFQNNTKISESQGAAIKEQCEKSIDCYSLNAVCVNLTFTQMCLCSWSNNITQTEDSMTVACLKPVNEGDSCNFDSECTQFQQDYTCSTTEHECTCSGKKISVDGGYVDPMCVRPAYLMESCDFDEQCQLRLGDSVCVNSVCDCPQGFIKNMGSSPEQNYCSKQIVTWNKKCDQDEFVKNNVCYIECNVNKSDVDPLQLKSFAWKYYAEYNLDTDPHFSSYQLLNGVVDASTDTAYTMGLNLMSVSAGYYVCEYTFLNDTQQIVDRNHLKISSSKGFGIGLICNSSMECLSLNAKCHPKQYTSVCACSYNLTYVDSLDSTTVACLSPLQEGSYCNFNTECAQYQQAYTCSSTGHNCTCSGIKEHVDGGYVDPMCIKQVYLMSLCDFTEQCLLAADNSYCTMQMCDCVDGYTMVMEGHPNEFYCYKPPTGVTTWGTGAIIGVSIGCGAGLLIIVGIIVYFVKMSAW